MVLTRKKQKKNKELQIKTMLKHFKIRNCGVNLVRLHLDHAEFRSAIFRKFKIRDCHVRIHHLNEEDIRKICNKKKKLLTPKLGTVRKNVSWLPTSASTRTNSTQALSTLAAHQKQHGISPMPKKQLRQQHSTEACAKLATMDDMHAEFFQKSNSSNRGLKSVLQRELPHVGPEPKSIFQKIHEEFKAKIAANDKKRN